MNHCIDVPISWWTLERYTIGDISAEEHAHVKGHLDACPLCRTRLDTINADQRPLPALSIPVPTGTVRPSLFDRLGRRPVFAAVGAAVGILCILVLPSLFEGTTGTQQHGGVAPRGGKPALTVITERNGSVSKNPVYYLSGDRFRLTLTLPGTTPRYVDIAVFQEEEVFFPTDDAVRVEPGNHQNLPGAFRATGTAPVTICVMIEPSLPARERLIEEGLDALPEAAICHPLTSPPVR